MPYSRHGRNLRSYRCAAARLPCEHAICWLCGEEIARSLPSTHRVSWTADHVESLARGSHILGPLRPARRASNSSKGSKSEAELIGPLTTSRAW